MPAITFLGVVATGDLYASGAPVSSPLELTTTIDMPLSARPHYAPLVILLRVAPGVTAGGVSDFAVGTVSDDAPDPGDGIAANVYNELGAGGSGGYAYGFGRPTTECDANFGTFGADEASYSGGSGIALVYCFPTRPIPAGSTISIPFTATEVTLLGATVLGFLDAGDPEVNLSAKTITPANIEDGDSANIPLGDHIFSELFDGQEIVIAHVFADDSPVDSGSGRAPGLLPVIDGAQTIDDDGVGSWTKVDAGGRANTSDFGGLIYSVFLADTNGIDLTQPMVTFTISDGIGDSTSEPRSGASDGGPFAGVGLYKIGFQSQVVGTPAASRVFPV